jgi:hypothetical protein
MIGLMIHSTVTDPLSVYYEPVATVARGYTEQIHFIASETQWDGMGRHVNGSREVGGR